MPINNNNNNNIFLITMFATLTFFVCTHVQYNQMFDLPKKYCFSYQTGQVLGRVNMVSGHVKTQLIAHDKEVCIYIFQNTCTCTYDHLAIY